MHAQLFLAAVGAAPDTGTYNAGERKKTRAR
jgi:hypothetical protein